MAHKGIGRRFGDLKVRPKLMVLHNLFFLVLACAVYAALMPLFEQLVESAEERELLVVSRALSTDSREGTAAALAIPPEIRTWLDAHPGQIYRDAGTAALPRLLYRKDPQTGLYRRLHITGAVYHGILTRARIYLFLVLGAIYVLAVVLLELIIMPSYVYGPIRLVLKADEASQHGDRARELVHESLIPGDEIGQIMRSRNATVVELRRQELELEEALQQLRMTAEDLQRKNELLESHDRLVSLGLLSASVAHEINTPLAVLQGSIEKLTESTADSQTLERLARMLRVTQRLRKISEALVDFSRVRRQSMESVLVKPLLDEAWTLVAIDPKASTAAFTNAASESAAVHANADRLMQVFVNLLRNALSAVPASGHIIVHTSGSVRNQQRWLTISVEDDGPGIPADVLPDIFEAFVSTRLDARGTGLGLTVAEGIIHQHGGTISAANRPQGGARLEVSLPAV
jgi:signal transduction histidine kinase